MTAVYRSTNPFGIVYYFKIVKLYNNLIYLCTIYNRDDVVGIHVHFTRTAIHTYS